MDYRIYGFLLALLCAILAIVAVGFPASRQEIFSALGEFCAGKGGVMKVGKSGRNFWRSLKLYAGDNLLDLLVWYGRHTPFVRKDR